MHKLTYKHTVLACYLTYITSAVSNNLVPLLFVTFNKQFGLTLDKLAFIITMNFGSRFLSILPVQNLPTASATKSLS